MDETPLYVPTPIGDIADAVWTRAGRALDPNNPTSILSRVDRLLNGEFVRPYVIEEVEVDDIAAIGPTNLSPISITPTFPTGATEVKVYGIFTLHILNDTTNAQKIRCKLQAQIAGGGYVDVWDPQDGGATYDVSGTPANASPAVITVICDLSAYVASGSASDFRFVVTQTSANSVHYTTQGSLYLVYRL